MTTVTTTEFTPILRGAVDRIPGAVGAIFADAEGEAVDQYGGPGIDVVTLRTLGAHYGIILRQVQGALHLHHYGEAEEVILRHGHMDLLVHAVAHGYYLVVAVRGQAHLGTALRVVSRAALELRSRV